jgi:hypothetical protein
MQYQVPQFDDVEDKIAGPFTLRQFIYICTSIGASFFLYFTVNVSLSKRLPLQTSQVT